MIRRVESSERGLSPSFSVKVQGRTRSSGRSRRFQPHEAGGVLRKVANCSVRTRQMTRGEEEGTVMHPFRLKNWVVGMKLVWSW